MAGIAAAVSIAGLGSAIGIGLAASAAAGVMSEDPRNFGKYLMLVGLPGTQGIYGFIIAFLWIYKLRVMSDNPMTLAWPAGLLIFFACLPVGICGLSAVYQGKVCAAGVNLTAKRGEESGKALVMGVFVEFYAVLGFLTSIFVYLGSDYLLAMK
jgi:V/A-type H+-transporting ATPase subunit K